MSEEILKSLKDERDKAMDDAIKTAYAYFCACDIGTEREKAFEIYENLRTAGRVY
jgi:hypothetical protein